MLQATSYEQAVETTQRLRVFLEQHKGQVALLERQRQEELGKQAELQQQVSIVSEAQVLLQQVAGVSRLQVKMLVEPLLSKALQVLLGGEAGFRLEYKESRGKWEVHFVTVNPRGIEGEGIESFGGGVVDLESMLLRLMFLLRAGLPPVLVLDEPWRNIHGKQAAEVVQGFVQRLVEDLHFQIIVITGDEDTGIEFADTIIQVSEGDIGSEVRHIKVGQ